MNASFLPSFLSSFLRSDRVVSFSRWGVQTVRRQSWAWNQTVCLAMTMYFLRAPEMWQVPFVIYLVFFSRDWSNRSILGSSISDPFIKYLFTMKIDPNCDQKLIFCTKSNFRSFWIEITKKWSFLGWIGKSGSIDDLSSGSSHLTPKK